MRGLHTLILERRRALALALPFALVALGARLAAAPIGDSIAGDLAALVSPRAARTPAFLEARLADEEPRAHGITSSAFDDIFASGRRVSAPSGPTNDAGAPVVGEPIKGTIVVPAAAVARAMARRDVGATNAVAADGSPLGARLIGVGRYRTGLRDGDVVVSVAGTPTPDVQAMVGAGMSAAQGASRISGRIVRGDATYAVVIELPSNPEPRPPAPPP